MKTWRDRVFAAAVATLALGGACGGDGDEGAGGGGPAGDTPDLPDPPAAPATPYGTIAYTRGDELRVIEPDGSGDRLVWRAPPVGSGDLTYSITGPSWRPDGAEIAFSSDHEQAFSPYDTDIYAVRGDGQNLRKLTHAPAHDLLDRYPKGAVTVGVQVTTTGGPFFVIVEGAPEPKLVSASGTLTFDGVADLGSGLQEVVATNGAERWLGAAVDVRVGKTSDAGVLDITPRGGIPGYRAEAPFWRADGKEIGFLGPLCQPSRLPVDPPTLAAEMPLVAPDASYGLCAIDWGKGGQLALGTVGFDDEGRTLVYVAAPGATSLPSPLVTAENYRRLTDLHWLASGTGFVIALQDDLLDEDVNLVEVSVPSGQTRQLTDFSFGGEVMRDFTISPDGLTIVFERTDDLLFGKSDLWISASDGSGLRRLVSGGGYPAWNPAAASHAPVR